MAEQGAPLSFTAAQTGGTQYATLPEGGSNIDIYDKDSAAFQITATDATPAAKLTGEADFTDDGGDILVTEAAHGFLTGLKGQFTTSNTLPTGISLATDYFIVKVDADTYKVATSLANALAGTVIAFTDNGTGNHTFTPTALAASVTPEYSLDGEHFWTITDEDETITATGTQGWKINDTYMPIARIALTVTAGALTAEGFYISK